MSLLLAKRFSAMARRAIESTCRNTVVHRREMHHHPIHGPIGPDGLPESVDWEKHGVFPRIQNQGAYGVCWAISAVTAIGAINKIRGNPLIKLSVQQILDCVDVNSRGCRGGDARSALRYVALNGGIVSHKDYPDCHLQHIGCKRILAHGVKIDEVVFVEDISDQDLKTLVAMQPISATVGADEVFEEYYFESIKGRRKRPISSSENITSDLIIDGPNYALETLDDLDIAHEVVIAGYGRSIDDVLYWKVRNSWGEREGVDGYWYVARETGKIGGAFGINRDICYPIKESPNGLVDVKLESEILRRRPYYRSFRLPPLSL